MPAHRSDSRGLLARLPTRVRVGLAALFFVVIALTPTFISQQYYLDVLIKVGLWAMLACGLNIVVAQAGLLDLGYIAFWGVGAYTTALFSSTAHDLHLPTWVCLPASAAAAAVFAIIIGFPTLRLRGDYLAIVTLGFGEIVRIALNNLVTLTGGPSGIQAIDPPTLPGFAAGSQLAPYYYLVLAGVVLVVAVSVWLRRGRLGMAWVALRDDELAARASGLYPLRYYLLAFGLGATFAGLSGGIFAYVQAAVSPDSFTVDQSFQVLAIVVLAGLSGRVWPVLLATALIIVLPEALRGFDEYRLVLFGPILVAVVAFRHNAAAIKQLGRNLRERSSRGTVRPADSASLQHGEAEGSLR